MGKSLISTNNLSPLPNPEHGYAALLSVIVMGAFLIAATTGFAARSMTHRLSALNHELKAQSRELAASCGAKALLNYALDQSYRGNEIITLEGGDQCLIRPFVITDGTIFTILTSAQQSNILTVLETVIKVSDLSVVSRHEIIN